MYLSKKSLPLNGTKPAGGWSLVQDNATVVSVTFVTLSVKVGLRLGVGSGSALLFCGKVKNGEMKSKRNIKAKLLLILPMISIRHIESIKG